MATIFSVNSIGLGNRIVMSSTGSYHITKNVTVASTNSNVVLQNGISNAFMSVEGAIIGDLNGIALSAGSNYNHFDIGTTGSMSAFYNAIYLGGTGNTISNSGQVTSYETTAVSLAGSDSVMHNSGRLTSFGQLDFYASLQVNGDNSKVFNSGIMETFHENAAALRIATATGDTTYFENTGLVIAPNIAVYDVNGSKTTVVNKGHISGQIILGGGNDLFDGRGGTVEGRVRGTGGNDTYIIDDPETELLEKGGEGIDLVKTTTSYALDSHFEKLTLIGSGDIDGAGNGANNTLRGNSGDNRLDGLGGKDKLYGRGGDDDLRGGRKSDVISGDSGDDLLRGGLDNDILRGGDDDDILVGGLGRDTLNGGAGADAFRFNRAAHSKIGNAADKIIGFKPGEDVIDLSNLPGGDYRIRAGAFTGNGPELRLIKAGKDTNILIDTDGNRVADMEIVVVKAQGLDAADFLL